MWIFSGIAQYIMFVYKTAKFAPVWTTIFKIHAIFVHETLNEHALHLCRTFNDVQKILKEKFKNVLKAFRTTVFASSLQPFKCFLLKHCHTLLKILMKQ